MAIDDNLERDPRLARLYQAAADEEPPAALDAAILAAARREVGARPQGVGGGTVTSIPPLRAKRNWYVPVSIAAVLVLSVSLVTLVHQEKGDELAQPPTVTSVPQSASVSPKISASAPAADAPAAVVAQAAKEDALLRDAAPAKSKVAEEKRAEPAKGTNVAAAPEPYGELARKHRTGKIESAADGAAATLGTARKDQVAGVVTREQGPASEMASALKTAPGAAVGGFSAGTPAPARERRPEPFPATRERETSLPAPAATPVPTPAPAQASRDMAEARTRSEANRNVAPPAPVAAAPRRVAPADDTQAQSAPTMAEGRVLATPPPPPPPAAKPAPPPPLKAARLAEKRPPVWRGLEDQPPEKWLVRLAEFKRDGRQTDADELLAEFRRRFPDHPGSAR